MKEKLIELIKQAKYCTAEELAEYLIAAGLVLPTRCENCVHYRHGTSCVCELHSEEPDRYGNGFDMQMLPCDFCSYGERKD